MRFPVKRERVVSSEFSVNRVELFPDDAIEVGVVIDAYSIKGWLKITPYACVDLNSGALLSAASWWLIRSGVYSAARVISRKKHGAAVIAQLTGYSDRDQALSLRGATVHVRRADFPVLEYNEYYWVDLIGLAVITTSNDVLGYVVNLVNNGAHSILCVEYEKVARNGRIKKAERLIPFVDAYVKTVNLSDRCIVVDWEIDY
ncbi:ribosome maturation factor RimM [Candidatus Vallotiella sp. (ex Adelges kitamiensis)]|uniref:ribosome maturation factor RimM n=1 Tax=Candidatus Vallotiella sp. (ex Adelges kitamiensis) TaxID=2864217 RepID=UPI001CE2663D|nr:ribosome maturation factor RimM [Candidatus Vallotia sp. (ex Adelges kitamiensis)]